MALELRLWLWRQPNELVSLRFPIAQKPLRTGARCLFGVEAYQFANGISGFLIELIPCLRLKERIVKTAFVQEIPIFVVDPREATGHARAEVDAGAAEDDCEAAGHVFAGVVANTFDHGIRSGVANRKALACAARGKKPAAGCAVQRDVADERVSLALLRNASATADNEFAAAETFTDEIIGEAFEGERHSIRSEGSERLAGSAVEIEGEL